MRNFLLCTILIALLAAQPVCAQEMVTIPLQQPAATPPPSSGQAVLPDGIEVRLVLLDSISSATATKGQLVHFAVAQNGISELPPGTTATGVVKSVRKGIPGKQNGYLKVEPRTIVLANGTKLKLVRSTEDCQITIAGCWVFVVLATAALAILLPIELPALAFYGTKNLHQRRLLTPIHAKIEGRDVVHKPCERYTAYTARKLKISPSQGSTTGPATEATLNACPAR